jgi:fumarate reductase flavoprotein subunit
MLAAAALVLSACGGAPNPAIATIKAGVATSNSLAGIHHRVNKPCETCHGTSLGSGSPTVPDTKKCLSCHGATYEGHAARTDRLGTQNPHRSHAGQFDCTSCHHGHKPFEHECNTCHSFPVPEKYKQAA